MNGDGPTNEGAPVFAASNIKIPPFWRDEPDIWFIQIEASFSIAKITKDEIKYHLLIANLDTSVLPFIADILRNPPNTHKYEALKNRILALFGQSNEVKIRRLLKGQLLGDQKPSHFLQHLKNLAGNVSTNDIHSGV